MSAVYFNSICAVTDSVYTSYISISTLIFQVHIRNMPSLHTQYSRVSLSPHLQIFPNFFYISKACDSKGHQSMPSARSHLLYKFPVLINFLPLWPKSTNPPTPSHKKTSTQTKTKHQISLEWRVKEGKTCFGSWVYSVQSMVICPLCVSACCKAEPSRKKWRALRRDSCLRDYHIV